MSFCSTYPTSFSLLMALSALLVAMFCTPLSSRAGEMLSVDKPQTSTTLNFAIVIPAALRILENSHPALLSADMGAAPVSALQRMVLVSTLRKGFCVDLRLNPQQVADWQLSLSGSAGTRMETADGGYRICTSHAGRFELALQHVFNLKTGQAAPASQAFALRWPVSMSLASL